MGDMDAKVGDEGIDEVLGKWGASEKNKNGDSLVNVCVEWGFLVKYLFSAQ